MKRFIFLMIGLAIMLWFPAPSVCETVKLRYHFKPGDQWECTRMNRMSFMVMGQKHTKQQRDTILYTVSKGQKKNWVRLSAQFINPPPKTDENRFSMGQYDFTYTADVHTSGDTRNIVVSGVENVMQDPSFSPQEKAALIQSNRIMAESLKPSIFWFPEMPEDALRSGDEFEDRRTHGLKASQMASKSQSRQVFVLEDVSEGLAYFSTKARHVTKTSTMGGDVKGTSSGKGETIFDLKEGMWIEVTTKSKMAFSGAMMGSGNGQEMVITEKMLMQRR